MSKKPTLIAYSIRKREGQNDFWARIGAAWPHERGNVMTIRLDALPIDGRIVLTEPCRMGLLRVASAAARSRD
jgi:hypothetical protein